MTKASAFSDVARSFVLQKTIGLCLTFDQYSLCLFLENLGAPFEEIEFSKPLLAQSFRRVWNETLIVDSSLCHHAFLYPTHLLRMTKETQGLVKARRLAKKRVRTETGTVKEYIGFPISNGIFLRIS